MPALLTRTGGTSQRASTRSRRRLEVDSRRHVGRDDIHQCRRSASRSSASAASVSVPGSVSATTRCRQPAALGPDRAEVACGAGDDGDAAADSARHAVALAHELVERERARP